MTMPFLKRLSMRWEELPPDKRDSFPYNIPALRRLEELEFRANVTFFTGDNGSGKSTLLEAIGDLCGFNIVGGKDTVVRNQMDDVSLTSIMKLHWLPKVNHGLYFRAETFDTFANYIDELAKEPYIGRQAYAPYGGISLHQRSHGQAFLTFFENRLQKKGVYLLDEPESALSPQNQLAFLRLIHDMEQSSQAQFIMATHSPILMAYPGAVIYHFQEDRIEEIAYEETEHYTLTRDFLNHRERYLRMLFE